MISEKPAIFRYRTVVDFRDEFRVADELNIFPFISFGILDQNSDGFFVWKSLSWTKNSNYMLLVVLVDLDVYMEG